MTEAKHPDRLWGPPSLNGYRGSFLRVKQPRHEVYHSPEVKNECLYTSTPPTGLYEVEREHFPLSQHLPTGIQEIYVLVN